MNGIVPIVPITQARSKLGDLTDRVSGDRYIILTKGGNAKAALVDIVYLTKLQNDLKKLYQKTYIDPTLITYTREFSDEEIQEWLKEDTL
ncbi:type II toxin-antitoxin system Phd/YefM family antitoxin [Candidatus Gottesmanbacteria bacterium]|nr:type II toxin-antitoxin system Phd/YefM family antitoxin [Candidatus Gottesmanbacteria bacterium]